MSEVDYQNNVLLNVYILGAVNSTFSFVVPYCSLHEGNVMCCNKIYFGY